MAHDYIREKRHFSYRRNVMYHLKNHIVKKLPFIILCLSVGFSCTSQNDHKSKEIDAQKTQLKDTLLTAQYYEELNEIVDYLDVSKNPYLTQKSDIDLAACNNPTNDSIHKQCIINQFQVVDFPVHVGPTHNIPITNRSLLEDSLFIKECIGDKKYFEEEERMYSYYYGKQVAKNENYMLLLIAEVFSVGKSFILVSVSTKDLKLIDKITLGAEISDAKSIFGKIMDNTHFEIDTKNFGYDEKSDLMFFQSEKTIKYKVSNDGSFIEIK
jgi:hypothetical protein